MVIGLSAELLPCQILELGCLGRIADAFNTTFHLALYVYNTLTFLNC